MAVYVPQSIGIGTVPNDDTGDDLRVGADKVNDNFDEIFGALAFEAGGPLSITFDAAGNAIASNNVGIGTTPAITLDVFGGSGTKPPNTLTTQIQAFFSNGSTGNGGISVASTSVEGFMQANESGNVFIVGSLSNDPVAIRSNNTTALDITVSQDILPGATAIQDLGSASKQYDNAFFVNSPTISDIRKKNDIGSADPLIAVMKLLKPRIFSLKSEMVKPAVVEIKAQRQKVETVREQVAKIEIIDGVPTAIMKTVDVKKPVVKMMTVKDENGNSVKKDGKVLEYPVPVMEDYSVPSENEIVVSHGRPHSGFMAQHVKQAMTDAGVKDWAGYAYHDDDGEDTHVLRLLEFIAPMLAYIQELEGRLKKLEKLK